MPRSAIVWLLGYALLLLVPALILFTVGLLVVGAAWFLLWVAFLMVVIRYFPRIRTQRRP